MAGFHSNSGTTTAKELVDGPGASAAGPCKGRCRKRCCAKVLAVLSLLTLLGLFMGDKHHRNHGYPERCFVEDDAEERLEEDTELLEDLAEECEAQISSLCATEIAALDGSLSSSLVVQRCMSTRFFELGQDCREELAESAFFSPALFPSVMLNSTLVEAAIDACEDDAEDNCRSQARYFDDDNMCQVYEIGLCLVSQPEELSGSCAAALDALNLTLPQDYDEDDFSLRHDDYNEHVFLNVLVWIATTAVLVILGRKAFLYVRAKRNERLGVASVRSESVSSENPAFYKDLAEAKTEV